MRCATLLCDLKPSQRLIYVAVPTSYPRRTGSVSHAASHCMVIHVYPALLMRFLPLTEYRGGRRRQRKRHKFMLQKWPPFIVVRSFDAAQSTHLIDCSLERTHTTAIMQGHEQNAMDTSEELACIKVSLSFIYCT
jgi:hypothetical protein